MKHATAETLAEVDQLLQKLRAFDALVERTPGAFYLKSKAFLHFHDDLAGVFVDIKFDPGLFRRFRVNTQQEQALVMRLVAKHLRR